MYKTLYLLSLILIHYSLYYYYYYYSCTERRSTSKVLHGASRNTKPGPRKMPYCVGISVIDPRLLRAHGWNLEVSFRHDKGIEPLKRVSAGYEARHQKSCTCQDEGLAVGYRPGQLLCTSDLYPAGPPFNTPIMPNRNL